MELTTVRAGELVAKAALSLSSQSVVSLQTTHQGHQDHGEPNLFGKNVKFTKVRFDQDDLFKVLTEVELSHVLLSSSELLLTVPTMFSCVANRLPSVFHVDVPGDHTPVLAASQSGFCILSSFGAKESYDLTFIAHVAAVKLRTPFLHFFDGSVTEQFKGKNPSEIIVDGTSEIFSKIESKKETPVPPSYTKTYLTVDPVAVAQIMTHLSPHLDHNYHPFDYTGASDAHVVVVTMGIDISALEKAATVAFAPHRPTVGFLKVRLYRPWSVVHFLEALPVTVKHVAVIECSSTGPTTWTPLFLDVAASFQNTDLHPRITSSRVSSPRHPLNRAPEFLHHLKSGTLPDGFSLDPAVGDPSVSVGDPSAAVREGQDLRGRVLEVSDTEGAYFKLLGQVFLDRLEVANALNFKTVWGDADAPRTVTPNGSVDFGYGMLLETLRARKAFVGYVGKVLSDGVRMSIGLRKELLSWVDNRNNPTLSLSTLFSNLSTEKSNDPQLDYLHNHRHYFRKKSHWLIGNDRWALDLGQSGIHDILAGGENIKLLLLDSQCYSTGPDATRCGKKDVGLYAMNYGGAYVASVAVYANYTQAYQALVEADAFDGPAVVVAYAPVTLGVGTDDSPALAALKETKICVDNGTWPLYRWNPRAEHESRRFFLDSEKIKKDLEEFLRRENQLSLFVMESVDGLENNLEKKMEFRHVRIHSKILESYAKLATGLNGPEMVILYGSDGGNAEGVAKRVFEEVSSLGARAKCMAMNDFEVALLPQEKNLVFVISTAGQGEFPANSKDFWKELCNSDIMLTDTSFAVFSMGDKNYWPRPEEAIYFAKAGRDLDAKLGTISGNRVVECGIGDDQDPDGFESGFQLWLPKLLKAFQLGTGEAAAKKPIPSDEDIKKNSNYLRGTIAKSLEDPSTGSVCYEDSKLLKFHGIYMQDDRDLREERRKQGVEKAFIFMARIRIPGGICTPKQWLTLDDISEKYCNGTIKITTRQALQYHGILKRNLKKSIAEVNHALLDTLAACGDVNRNVMCNPNPYQSKVHGIVYDFSKKLSEHLSPRTAAYHEIWLDQKPVAGNAVKDVEPFYGPTYLPRKFKVAIAIPPHNDVDVYCHDLGYIAVVNTDTGEFEGFNVVIGGGMGMTHNNTKTYPCIGQPLAFCTLSQAIDVGEKVMIVQQQNGDRKNRKHARLKYTLLDHGMDWYRSEVERLLGYTLLPPRTDVIPFETNGDTYDWVRGIDGKWYFTIFVEHGRVRDTAEYRLRTGLRELATVHEGDFRFTGNQNFMVGGVTDDKKKDIEAILSKYHIDNQRWSALRLHSVACTSLPTCGLAFAESERYLPRLITLLEDTVNECGLRHDAIHIRMSGCPNGCSRPYMGEIAMVGRAPGIYNLYLGAGFKGERMNKLFKESLNEDDLLREIKPLIKRYSTERLQGEYFGDFVVRVGILKATINGPDFHDQ